jgi:L-ascorbate metabolism protein UlaG (beta-lactamase superfamily)
MERRIIKYNHRQMAQLVDRRQFLQLSGKVGLMAAATGFTGGLIGCSSATQAHAAEAEVLADRPYHHTANGFRNPPGSPSHKHNLSNVVRHIWHEMAGDDQELPEGHFTGQDRAAAQLATFGNSDKITWLGHSAFLIRMSDTNILLDPFLSDYATLAPPFGPKRFTPPGLPLEKLPRVDLVLISHNHYDHMDKVTLTSLPNRQNIPIIVPLGLRKICLELGYKKVTELDWYGTTRSGLIKITSLPAVHFSGRGLFDRNETLWTSYALTDGRTKIHFCGDTANHPLFRKTGLKYGPFDYGMVPIGAYRPGSASKGLHATPEEAVKLGRDMRARTLIPMHWGTILLSQAPPFEAPVRFLKAGLAAGYDESALWKMKVGETRVI